MDPSFSRFGIVGYREEHLYIHHLKHKLGDRGFPNVFTISRKITRDIIRLINVWGIEPVYIYSEEPPPRAMFSAGLYMLSSILLHTLMLRYKGIQSFHTVPTMYLSHIHQKRGYAKAESVTMGKNLLDIYSQKYTIHLDNRLSHDQAEALIFFTRLHYCKSPLFRSQFLELSPNFASEKEKLLFNKLPGGVA